MTCVFRPIAILLILLATGSLQAQNARQLYRAGIESAEKGNYSNAVEQFTRSISADPEYIKSYIQRAKAYEALDDLPNAAEDLAKALTFETKKEDIYFEAARVNFMLSEFNYAQELIIKCLALKSGQDAAFRLQCRILLGLGDPASALISINKALSLKEDPENYFYRAQVSEKLQNFNQAEADYGKCITKNNRYTEAFLRLANLQLRMDKPQSAMQNCNAVIGYDPENHEAFLIRSQVFARLKEFPKAIDDMSRILTRTPEDKEMYFIRGTYYLDFTQYQNAISDFNHALLIDPNYPDALYQRAYSYEQAGDFRAAIKDYERLTRLSSSDTKAQDLLSDVRKRLFELNRETDPPVIRLTDPVIQADSTIDMAKNKNFIVLHGRIIEESELNYVRINNNPVSFTRNGSTYEFDAKIDVSLMESVSITAMDVYANEQTIRCMLNRTETDDPRISILSPYPSDDGEIYLDNSDNNLYIEGSVQDESLIRTIAIDSVTASFSLKDHNPRFSVNIDVAGKNKFTVTASDIYGNDTTQTFVLNRSGITALQSNPMGRTWVVFIENSAYDTYPSLEGPSRDVASIRSALAGYDIQKIIHKQNMTKMEMERFFAIELRDLLRNNHVNSLLIWYAGHGRYMEDTGYWLPVDARRDDEFSYYNLNALRASLQSYMGYLTHNLVISDACETGPSFYQAMRGSLEEGTCDNLTALGNKSCQVLSSAGYSGASDNSQFTRIFAKALEDNHAACLPIESIVNAITSRLARQQAEFGKITGLEDENGTFFFISRP